MQVVLIMTLKKVKINGKHFADLNPELADAFKEKFGPRKLLAALKEEAADMFGIDLGNIELETFDHILEEHFYISRADWARERLRIRIKS